MPGPGPRHVGASVGHQVGAQARASPTHQRPWGQRVGMEWGARPRASPRAGPSPPPGQRLEGSEGPAGPAADYQSAEIPARAGALARPGPAALSRVPIARGNQPRTPPYGGPAGARTRYTLQNCATQNRGPSSLPFPTGGTWRGDDRENDFHGYQLDRGSSGGCFDYERSTGFAKQASGDGGLGYTPVEGGYVQKVQTPSSAWVVSGPGAGL